MEKLYLTRTNGHMQCLVHGSSALARIPCKPAVLANPHVSIVLKLLCGMVVQINQNTAPFTNFRHFGKRNLGQFPYGSFQKSVATIETPR